MKKLNLPIDLKQADKVWFENCLYQILDTAIDADYAIMGNIQLFNSNNNALQIVAQRGFDIFFLQHFGSVRDHDGSVCGRAFSERRRVAISDVHVDESFSSHRSIAHSSGFRAVQSTPIFSGGAVRGVISTHFPIIHRLTDRAGATLDGCAAQIGKLVERFEAA